MLEHKLNPLQVKLRRCHAKQRHVSIHIKRAGKQRDACQTNTITQAQYTHNTTTTQCGPGHHVPTQVWDTDAHNSPGAQSFTVPHAAPTEQRAQLLLPPQSTSLSSASITPFAHVSLQSLLNEHDVTSCRAAGSGHGLPMPDANTMIGLRRLCKPVELHDCAALTQAVHSLQTSLTSQFSSLFGDPEAVGDRLGDGVAEGVAV